LPSPIEAVRLLRLKYNAVIGYERFVCSPSLGVGQGRVTIRSKYGGIGQQSKKRLLGCPANRMLAAASTLSSHFRVAMWCLWPDSASASQTFVSQRHAHGRRLHELPPRSACQTHSGVISSSRPAMCAQWTKGNFGDSSPTRWSEIAITDPFHLWVVAGTAVRNSHEK
jgi:hypothetical protein